MELELLKRIRQRIWECKHEAIMSDKEGVVNHVYELLPEINAAIKRATPEPSGEASIAQYLPTDERNALNGLYEAMAKKLYDKWAEGFSGFECASADHLSNSLRKHVEKGDTIDVANICAFLHHNGQRILAHPSADSRDDVLEEVARVCESAKFKWSTPGLARDEIAAAIRTLKRQRNLRATPERNGNG
jgi:hypothetical protein